MKNERSRHFLFKNDTIGTLPYYKTLLVRKWPFVFLNMFVSSTIQNFSMEDSHKSTVSYNIASETNVVLLSEQYLISGHLEKHADVAFVLIREWAKYDDSTFYFHRSLAAIASRKRGTVIHFME